MYFCFILNNIICVVSKDKDKGVHIETCLLVSDRVSVDRWNYLNVELKHWSVKDPLVRKSLTSL